MKGKRAEMFRRPPTPVTAYWSTPSYLDGMTVAEAKTAMTERLAADGRGRARVEYKLRDWLFARQRYWGEPFPVVYDADGPCRTACPNRYCRWNCRTCRTIRRCCSTPTTPTASRRRRWARPTDWVNVELDLGDGLQHYTRDTNVMPQWAGSSWYELRYADPHNSEEFCAKENEAYWMGPRPAEHGAERSRVASTSTSVASSTRCCTCCIARFWHKVLYDLGHVTLPRAVPPAGQPGLHPGVRLHRRARLLCAGRRSGRARRQVLLAEPTVQIEVFQEFGKIGKSLKNSVSPDEICDDYGADTLRVYEMSMGPLEASRPWATKDVVGALPVPAAGVAAGGRRADRCGAGRPTTRRSTTGTLKALHRTIDGVSEDYANLRNNTAAAKLIEYTNHLTKEQGDGPRAAVEPLVLMLAPLAPHLAEDLWHRLGHDTSLAHGPFPVADPRYLVEDSVEYPGAGQRQGPRPDHRGRRRGRRRGGGRRPGRREGAGLPGRRQRRGR